MAAGAVSIPQYRPQVGTPNGQVAGASGRGAPTSELDTRGFTQFEYDLKRSRQQTEINNANAEISAEEPRAQLAIATKFDEIQRDWTPGSPPVPEQMFEFIDQYRQDAETRFTSPHTKALMSEKANQFKTEYGLKGFAYQTKMEVDTRVGTYKTTYENIASLASTDPSKFAPELAKINATVMQDDQIPAAAKEAFIREQSQAAALKVGKAVAELQPQSALAMTNALLGVSMPELKMSGATSKNIYADIVQRESGGRLYAESGKILRGPAITKKDGTVEYAYGKYQLLAGTAKEAAKDLGIDWKPDVFFRDKTGDAKLDQETSDYHELLGRSYIDAQNDQFGGNPILIAAAHNMGPEATKGWAAGEPYQTQSGKWWYPKQPMDLAAMPDETRKYIDGLGTVTERPLSQTIDTTSEEATAFRFLPVEDLIAVRSIAQSNLAELQRQKDSAIAINKDIFKSRIVDIEVAAKNGDPIKLPPDDELVTYLGPAQAALTKQRLLGYQQMAGPLKRLPGMSNAELDAIANAPDPEGMDDRVNRQFIHDTIATKAKEQLAARTADPGKAALESSDMVKTAFTGYVSASQAFQSAGKEATPEMLDQLNTSRANYFKASFAQQRQWGIQEPKLPKTVVDDIASGWRGQLASGNVTAATMRMSNLPKELGSFEAISQVGEKTGDLGWFAMEGVPPAVVNQLHAATLQTPEEVSKLLPAGIKRTDVEKEVAVTFAPLTTTFATPDIDGTGDAVTANRYLKGGNALAMSYLSSGQASSAKEAAALAYRTLYADRETVVDGYRVPVNFNPKLVQQGLVRSLENLTPESVYVRTPIPGLTEAETRTNILRNMRRNGRWVTNEEGSGVYLMVAGKPALNAEGKPIQVQYVQAIREPVSQPEKAKMDAAALRFRVAR